jgi:catechol 2,3-dioxygenase-like lactoylglutathione lyase family enzyme
VFAVSDWQRSNSFYRDVLGADIDQRDAWFGHYRFGFRDPEGSLLEFVSHASDR